MIYPELYKLDTKGKIRVWFVEQEGPKYHVVAGLKDGKLVTAEWTTAEPKNIGKINETTAEEQATKEIEALYEVQLNQGRYFNNLADIENETYFKPMLAEKYNDRKSLLENHFSQGKPVYVDRKLDGGRLVLSNKGMFTREGKEYFSCPHIYEYLKDYLVKHPNIILDGELYNHEYHDNFNKIQSLIMKKKPTELDLLESREKVKYYIYDIFDKDNPDLIFSERLGSLLNLYENYIQNIEHKNSFVMVEHTLTWSFDGLDDHFSKSLEEGYEGQIIRFDVPYENKRTKYLLKRKDRIDREYVIQGIDFGEGNWAAVPKTMSFLTDEGKPFKGTLKGSREELIEKYSDESYWIGKLAEVAFPNYTPAGIPRQAIITKVYDSYKREF